MLRRKYMSNKNKFYICKKCGKIIEMVQNTQIDTVCCGQAMEILKSGTIDARHEKHVPVVKQIDNEIVEIQVGTVNHPMTEEHSILWICLETDKGIYRKNLSINSVPGAVFKITSNEHIVSVYAYCNLHGLWSANI